ncbi:hypothetical protein BH09PSE6_BH09PSE6_01140 [soil metagenome]
MNALPRVEARAVLGWAVLFASLTGIAQWLTRTPARQFDSPVQFTSDLVVFIGLGWCVLQQVFNRADARERSRWLMATGAMCLLGAIQTTDFLVDYGAIEDDWFIDLPLWFTVAVFVRLALASKPGKPWVMTLWKVAVGLQVVFVCCDFFDGRSFDWLPVSSSSIESVAEWVELMAIECHVVALVMFGAAWNAGVARARREPLAVGVEARRLYAEGHLFVRASYPPVRAAFYPGVHQAVLFVACLVLLAGHGRRVRQACGVPLARQLGELLELGFREAVDPLSYYQQELYRNGGLQEARYYLTRLETKNGLLKRLNSLKPQPFDNREMKDKALFAACCDEAGLAVPRTLMSSEGGAITWHVPPTSLTGDLFSKPRAGRGARGVHLYLQRADGSYVTDAGLQLDHEALIVALESRARRKATLVQRRLRNHPQIADLADRSLIAIRVLTCLDGDGEPVVTHGLLRVLSKLEPYWQCVDEFAAPIELDSGELGSFVSDRLDDGFVRHARHPVTDAQVEGRVLASWPAIKDLALRAHRRFAHRVIVGWDIAATDEGPVLLEGNTNLDVMFPQRAYRQGFGRGPLGPLLAIQLAALARSRRL